MLFVYRVTAGQEKVVAEMLSRKIKKDKLAIFSIAVFEDLKGYMIAEALDEVAIRQAGMKIPYIKGVLAKTMAMPEIETLIESAKPAVLLITIGDIVELVSGPFKGEKAKVVRIDEGKEEVTVELTEVAVPIPVTVKANTIRVYQKVEDR
ncbi:transcription elongation factor Spt5 [Candidatus Micrarchaeota archaeon CG1_02_47_40]|nr:MAG: transcription elongation factor Spt5 [Candidatus Micrarchaeota archaeon CG1_02_47_40]